MLNARLSAIALTAVLLVACGKGDSPAPLTCRVVTSEITVGGTTYTVTYQYDAEGRLISAVTPQNSLSQVTTYTYDSRDLLVAVTNEGIITIEYSYNANRQRIKDSTYTIQSDPQIWSVTEYSYNTHGQLIQTVTRASTGDDTIVTYSYPNTSTKNFSSYVLTSGGVSQSAQVAYDDHLVKDDIRIILLSPYQTDNFQKSIVWDLGSTVHIQQYTYEFNAHGYPTLIQLESETLPVRVQKYTYYCQ